MRVSIGSDHRGVQLKAKLALLLENLGHEVLDEGAHSDQQPVDYPDVAAAVARKVSRSQADRGLLVCGTGIGMAITANKVAGVRASVVTSDETARLTRQDNDSNVLALGAKTVPSIDEAMGWLRTWLDTAFAGGRHERRVNKIRDYEARNTRA